MYRALTFCLQDALSFACITRGGGEGGTDPIYWSRYVYERENFKSQRSGEILKFSH